MQTQTEGHYTQYLTSTLQNCQGYKKQGQSEKFSQPRGGYKGMTTWCDVVLGMKNIISEKTSEIQGECEV